MKTTTEQNPWCVRCRLPMRSGGSVTTQWGGHTLTYRCPACRANVSHRSARGRRGRSYEPAADAPNPSCVKCRRRMRPAGHKTTAWAGRVTAYKCLPCHVYTLDRLISKEGARKLRARAQLESCRRKWGASPNPWCVACRRMMRGGGARAWNCPACGASPLRLRQAPHGGSAACVAGTREYYRERRERRAAELLKFAAALVPAHLPADVREEAAQAMAVDLIARRTTREKLTPKLVRRYVREARGMQDAYRFRSLDAPTRRDDGRALGELIAA